MMLYKYVPFEAGRKILETSTIGFSQPKYFNDPFDMPSYPSEPADNSIERVFDRMGVWGKEYIWGENTGILSLTRTPHNPLMWSHYADMHRGMVIGIEVVLAGLTDEQGNLIPAQYGSVIYVSQRPDQPFIGKPTSGLAVGATHHFPHDHYEKLQRLFLHKPLCWSYEEEVRVVKCLKGISADGSETQSGKFSIINHGSRPLYLLSIPSNAIKEVYLGFRSDHVVSDELYYSAGELHPHLMIYECRLDPRSYAVESAEYVTIAEATAE